MGYRLESVKPSIDSIISRPVKIEAGWSIIRGHGTSILHQPILSPVIMHNFRLISFNTLARVNETIQLTRSLYHLHVRLGNRMVLRALGLFKEFLWAECDPKMQFGCTAYNLMHYFGWKIPCRPHFNMPPFFSRLPRYIEALKIHPETCQSCPTGSPAKFASSDRSNIIFFLSHFLTRQSGHLLSRSPGETAWIPSR